MRLMTTVSIAQPYAWGIVYGRLRMINMDWATDYRGRLAIHAGYSMAHSQTTRLDNGTPVPAGLDYGSVIGAVTLIDIVPPNHPAVLGMAATGPHCWLVSDPHALEVPVKALGKLGLFTVDAQRIIDAQPWRFGTTEVPLPPARPQPTPSLFDHIPA